VARAIVTALKYGGCFGLAPMMAAAMEREARRVVSDGGEEGASDVALVPVPLAPARRRERGFNQARLLADALSSRTGWRVVGLLSRRGSGPSQASLGRRERASVGASGFAVRAGRDRPLAPRAARLLLVDDVVTTGITATACARALAASSLRVVGVVSFTRAPPRLPGS
jgi:predicted amidophosphoribosyltransferase